MIRIATALLALLGVFALSMPGGACFLWQGLGVDHHHHHQAESAQAPATACFHEHNDHCAGESEEPEPQEPCDSDDVDAILALAATIKVDPASLPVVADFTPEWLASSQAALDLVAHSALAAVAHGPPGDALGSASVCKAVVLCRFLI